MTKTRSTDPGKARIRPLEEEDLDILVDLCGEHAAYERASFEAEGKRENLRRLLLQKDSRAQCLLAECEGQVLGFVTFSPEVSTWDAAEYLHMDCLFLRPSARGKGLGKRLLAEVTKAAREGGYLHVQWQTPPWNESAIRFYKREGATFKEKLRFYLDPDPQGPESA